MEEYYTIDRFEEDFVVCENRKTRQIVNVRKSDIPSNAEEGSILKYKKGKYILDVEKTEDERKRILEKMDKLFNN